MDAKEIMQRLADKYTNCASYLDSGWVDFDESNQKRQRIDFKTQFLRPNYFRFDWQDYGPNRGKSEQFSTVWSDGHRTWFRQVNARGITTEGQHSLLMAITAATGCSCAAASIVPFLLNEDIGAMSFLILKDLELVSNETLAGHDCYVLKGSLFKSLDHILWIAVEDFSLRRVYRDQSWTAEESREEHIRLLADKEIMAGLLELGIAPPEQMEHEDTRFVLEFNYGSVDFDLPLTPNDFARSPETET